MRLYYFPRSTCSRRALMTARQLRVPVELVTINLAQGAQHAPDFLKLNPNHRVPVIEDDGLVLWESFAIMQYLADKTPGQTLYPADLRARADINRWLFWCAQHFSPPIGVLNWEHAIKALVGQGGADPTRVQRAEADFLEAAQVLDGHLAGRDWVCGTALSLADLAIAAPLADIEQAKLPIGALPELKRWFARMTALDVWTSTAP